MQTVREQLEHDLIQASTQLSGAGLYGDEKGQCPKHPDDKGWGFYNDHHADMNWRCWSCLLDALDRHRAEPEWRSQCCGKPPHEASDVTADNPVGFCCMCRESTVFEREPEEHCGCNGPDSLNCPTWERGYQAGLEAQRERVGGGTA